MAQKTKVWKLILGILLSFVFITLFLAPRIAKQWIQNNADSLIGRKISINKIRINYLKVAVRIDDFILYEKNGIDKFVAFDKLHVNFDPINLIFRNEYKFSKIHLTNPYVYVSQNGNEFNFTDIIPSDTTEIDSTENSEPFKFTIKNIKISHGNVVYNDLEIDNKIDIDNLSLNVPEISWNNRQSNIGVNFNIGENGNVSISSKILPAKESYSINLKTENINIDIIKNYLKAYLKIEDFSGLLSTDLFINGSIADYFDIYVSGKVAIDSLFVTDQNNNHLLSCEKASSTLSNIDLEDYNFHFSSFEVEKPRISAILYNDITNIEKVLGYDELSYEEPDTLAAEMLDTVNITDSTDNMEVKYRLDTLIIRNGDLHFYDSTLNRPFSYMLRSINITATNIADDAIKVPIEFSMKTISKGNVNGNMMLNLADTRYANLNLNVKKLDLTSFSPYSEYYIASPIKTGTLNYDMEFDLTPTELQNSNKIYISNLEFGEKTSDSTAIIVPIKLALYVMKDKDNKINIDLPVEGNPSNPEYKYTKLLWKTLSQLLIKVSAEPFKAMNNLVGTTAEEIEEIEFAYNQNNLTEEQIKVLEDIENILKNNPDIIFVFKQYTDIDEAKKLAAVYLAKRDYALSVGKNTDESTVNNISSANLLFREYVLSKSNTDTSISIDEACLKLYSERELFRIIMTKMKNRNELFKRFFNESEGDISNRIKFAIPDLRNSAAATKYPHYQLEINVD